MQPRYERQQPVPWERIPYPAGSLPSWEQKKLELGMAELSTIPSLSSSSSSSSFWPPLSNATQGQASYASNGSNGQQPFQSSSKERPERSGPQMKGPQSYSSQDQEHDHDHVHDHDTYSNLETSPSFTSFSHLAPDFQQQQLVKGIKRKRNNPFLRYIHRHFLVSWSSSKHNNSYSHGRNGNGNAHGHGHGHGTNGVIVIRVPQSHAGGIHNAKGNTGIVGKKTRSNVFAQKMRMTSGKVTTKLTQSWDRISSKTPKEQLPKTWEEWRRAYARGDIDIQDIPQPPAPSEVDGGTPTAREIEFLPAPMPEDQPERQLAFNRLDIEGKRGIKPSQIPVKEGEDPLPDTLEGHPAFRNIVTQARALFDSSISILTVFNDNRQLFLAETGLGGMREVPREVTFCSHAVLQRPVEPFILNDTHQDWRFAKSPLVVQYGSRAYYGVPLLAPDFSETANNQIPIGTLCVIDDKPHKDFTAEQRSKMGDLALLAQKTIANWSRARLQARLGEMEKSFQIWKNETTTLAGLQAAALRQATDARALAQGFNKVKSIKMGDEEKEEEQFKQKQKTVAGKKSSSNIHSAIIPEFARSTSKNSSQARRIPTPNTPPLTKQEHLNGNGNGNGNEADDILHITSRPKPTPPPSTIANNDQGGTLMPLSPYSPGPTSDDIDGASMHSYYTAPTHTQNRQKIYDISTRLVATSLELTLVYILRLDMNASSSPSSGTTETPQDEENNVKSLSLVSHYGLPNPEPAFDTVLHFKALRSEEGGLLYQNPDVLELVAGEKMPETEEVQYASALLVPICESDHAGYVLAGFTADPERVIERDDLLYLTTIASELAVYLMD